MNFNEGIVRPGDIVRRKTHVTGMTYMGTVTYVNYKYGWYTVQFQLPGREGTIVETYYINDMLTSKSKGGHDGVLRL